MGRWALIKSVLATSPVDPAPTFDVGPDEIDPALFGMASWASVTAPEARISRREAIQVPAVKRGRDLICGTLGSLPLDVYDAGNQFAGSPVSNLVTQPETSRPRSVTMTRTIEDMLFEGVAWWKVLKFNWTGYPEKVVRLNPRSVTLATEGIVWTRSDGSVQGESTEYVPDSNIIRIESPNDALLDAGARAIRTALRLDIAARSRAESPMPAGYFRPKEGADPVSDDDVVELLDNWNTARQTRSIAYVPAALEFVPVQSTARDDQLAEGRQHAVLEIARTMGVDPEDLGVSTTSRTYQNAESRRQDLINQTLAAYVVAIQDRLSMPDVTPRGYNVRFNFDAFLRSDSATRFKAYIDALATGALTKPEIRELEDRPALSAAELAPPMPAPAPLEASMPGPAVTFDTAPAVIALDAVHQMSFQADLTSRTITGLAVPFGRPARSGGRMWQFSRGSLTWGDPGRVKLLIGHDFSQAVGRAVELTETDAGLMATFKVARGEAGDRALILAEDRVLDGLSVGIGQGGTYDERDGINFATAAPLIEISLTPQPAFDDARLTAVTATADETRGSTMPGTETAPVVAPADTGPTFDTGAISKAITDGFAALPSFGPREVTPTGDGASFSSVNEAVPYRFDGGRGKVDFSSDLIAHLRNGDGEAGQRIAAFMAEMGPRFNVTQSGVSTLNPNRQRPDLYVDQRDYDYPMWDALNKGTLSDNTPFVLPKFSASSGLVADHVEGTEPTAGAFATTSQTITPSPLSGKVIINREVWDQGGNPQVSGLIWRQMVRAWYEGLEAYIQAQLVANAASITDITVTTASADAALEGSLTSQLAPLQYVRGGFRMRDFFLQVDLYKALVAAKDTAGRRLFPSLAPHNSIGQSEPYWAAININGLVARPAWATAATSVNPGSSWLIDRNDASIWASAPQRITMDNIAVATVQLGIWGYKAFAITDFTGLREVIYDPV
jgi:HK97 family phage portal protein/HK97 family phage prohead protease